MSLRNRVKIITNFKSIFYFPSLFPSFPRSKHSLKLQLAFDIKKKSNTIPRQTFKSFLEEDMSVTCYLANKPNLKIWDDVKISRFCTILFTVSSNSLLFPVIAVSTPIYIYIPLILSCPCSIELVIIFPSSIGLLMKSEEP